MKEPVWLDALAIAIIHDEMLVQHGGPPGVRDAKLLDSGLNRARNAHVYGETDLCELAAIYAAGVVKNHPFVDGNKRTGFLCAALFLELNGMRLEAPEPEVVAMTVALAGGQANESVYAQWLRTWAKD